MFTVEVISIGNELLNGRIANTNLQWLGERIYSLGGWIRRAVIVPDVLSEIVSAIREAVSRKPDLIITTGGLGPTYDDRTLEGVALAINVKLEECEEALEMIKTRLEELFKMGVVDSPDLTDSRRKMAKLPKGSKPLANYVGTAPGVLVEVNKTRIACLPGVPAEMKDMFDRYIAPLISKEEIEVIEVNYVIEDLPEAILAPEIEKLAHKYPEFYIKSHPKGFEEKSVVEVQVKGRGKRCREIVEEVLLELESSFKKLGAKFYKQNKNKG